MKVFTIIVGILLVIAGFFCLFVPGLTFLSVGWLVGLLLLISGISVIVDYIVLRKSGMFSGMDLFLGILTTILGIVLLVNTQLQYLTDVLAVYLLGIWMFVTGIVRIVEAVQARKVPGSGWGWFLFIGILMVILGIYAFFHPVVSAFTLAWLIGFFIIMNGFDLIFFGASMRKITDASGDKHWTIAN